MSVPPPSWVANRTLDGVGEVLGEVDHRRVEDDEPRAQGADRREHGGEHAGVDDRRGHRAALVDQQDHVALQRPRAPAVADEVSGTIVRSSGR